MKQKRRIRNLLIYPKFQLILVGGNCLFVLGSFLLLNLGLKKGFYNLKQAGVNAKVSLNHPFYEYLQHQETYIYQHIIAALILSIILTAFFSIIFSHKVVGPIKQLCTDIEKVTKGDDIKLAFRKGDYFQELPELVKKLIKNKKDES